MQFNSCIPHLWSALLLLWTVQLSSGAFHIPEESERHFTSGAVDSIQPLSYGYPESQVKRRLSQSTRSNDDDSVSCQLTASQRRQFYDTSSRQWIVTDAVLEELGNDLQSIIACTAQDDFILFSTRTRIKPRRPMTITRRLTLSAQPRGSLFRNGVLVETPRKVRLTCPDRGSLLTVRNGSITIANVVFSGCEGRASIVVLDARCNARSTRGVVHFLHSEFRNNIISGTGKLVETVDPSCADIIFQSTLLTRNQCETGCLELSLNNTLSDLQIVQNQGEGDSNTLVSRSIFMMPEDSETVVTNLTASRNQIRLFTLLDSNLTLLESYLDGNSLSLMHPNITQSIGGSVLFSNASRIEISDSVFVNNSGWNGGAIYASDSDFSLTNCIFRENNAHIGNGGGFYAINGTSFTLSRCTFSNNNAIRGAGIFSNHSSSVQVIESRFWSNNGTSGAGLYIVDGVMTIDASEFTQNNVSYGGSALVTSTVTTSILNSVFLENNATWGGACTFQYNSTVHLESVQLTDNHARNGAGAIYTNGSTVDFHNVSLNGNSAINDGGALYADYAVLSFAQVNVTDNFSDDDGILFFDNCSVSIDRVLFQDNIADWYGAGAYIRASNVSITGSSFVNNSVRWDGAGLYAIVQSRVEISESLFHNNSGGDDGGAFYASYSTVSIDRSNFTNNTADDGGACYFLNVNATIRRLVFIGNWATVGSGGGLFVDNSRVLGRALLFQSNVAVNSGGGCCGTNNRLLSLTQTQYFNNTGNYGGGIYTYNTVLRIRSPCIFHQNFGVTAGGGVYTRFFSNSSIPSCVFESNGAQYGGSVWIGEYSRSSVRNCTFLNSAATSHGGGIQIFNNTRVSVSNSSFTRCTSVSGGGGINIETQSNLTVTSCNFLRNSANCGAGVHIIDGNLNVSGSSFRVGRTVDSGGGICSTNGEIRVQDSAFIRNNVSDGSGGGIHLNDGGHLFARGLILRRNRALQGGGVYGDNVSSIEILDSQFQDNSASRGGGLHVYDLTGTLSCESVNFEGNTAHQDGGAVRVSYPDGVQSFVNCTFLRNTAEDGGCLAGLHAELMISNSLCQEGIASSEGGGLFFDTCNATISDTRITSNQARSFGGVLATDSSRIIATNLSSSSNAAVEEGGGLGLDEGSSLICNRCSFDDNIATRGAGLYIESDDSLPIVAQLQDTSLTNNAAVSYGGGMLFMRPQDVDIDCTAPNTTCTRVVLLNSIFQDNSAGHSGAAILTTDPEGVLISCTPQRLQSSFLDSEGVSPLETMVPTDLCRSWRRNQVTRDAPGDTIGTFGRVLSFSTDPEEEGQIIGDIHSGFILQNVASGVQLPVIFITVLDAYGHGPMGTNPNRLEVTMVSPDGFFQGIITTNITGGIGNFSNIVGFKPPGNYTLRISPDTVALSFAELVIQIRGCQVGEEPTVGGELCQKCDAVSFNFDPEQPGGCTSCPSDATCESRFIAPKDGYWHKSPCHVNVKECLTDEACSYGDRQNQLRAYTDELQNCGFNQSMLLEYSQVSCREGYEGPLCGSCSGTFGLSLGFKCSKCPHDFESVITLFFFTLYLLAISSFTIRGGLPFNSRNSRLSMPSTSGPRYNEVREDPQEAGVNLQMVEMLRDGYVPPAHFRELEAQRKLTRPTTPQQPQQQTNELQLTRWITTEIFKVIINFLQVTAVAAAINVRWTEGILVMFEASEYIGALTTAALSRPIDCIISSSSAAVRSVWRTLLSLLVPGAVMGIFACFWSYITFHENRGFSYFWKRLILSIVAVTYISYLGLTKLAVRVFYCVDVFDSDNAFTDSQNKVWAVDTSIQCYKKEHFGLIVIAVVILVLVSFLFPLMSAVILSQNKDQHRDMGSWTMETMGFLYRAFKDKFVFWESLIMLRKACLSIIVVFSYPLGGQSQGLLALAVLLSSLYLHLICSPYRKEFHRLNFYESGSLLVSCFTFIFGQFFGIERSSDSTRVLTAVGIIMMNTMFFAFLLFVFFRNGLVHIKVLLESEGHVFEEKTSLWIVLKVYITSRVTRWTHSKN